MPSLAQNQSPKWKSSCNFISHSQVKLDASYDKMDLIFELYGFKNQEIDTQHDILLPLCHFYPPPHHQFSSLVVVLPLTFVERYHLSLGTLRPQKSKKTDRYGVILMKKSNLRALRVKFPSKIEIFSWYLVNGGVYRKCYAFIWKLTKNITVLILSEFFVSAILGSK